MVTTATQPRLLERMNRSLMSSRGLQYTVRKYGADALSTYGGGAILAMGAMAGIGSIASYAAIAGAAGLVSFVNQLEHDYRDQELLEFYRDQVASAIHDKNSPTGTMNPALATVEHMRDYAFSDRCPNNILRCQLDNNDRERNINLWLHGLSAVLWGAAVLGAAALASLIDPAILSSMGIGLNVGVGAGSLLLFQEIDHAVSDIGKRVCDSGRPSAHSSIVQMQEQLHRGQKVSPLQVFSVMVYGDNELRNTIKKEYGADFDDLYLSDKQETLQRYGIPRNLNEVTRALNTGKMEAEDLVLTLCAREPAPHFTSSRSGGINIIDASRGRDDTKLLNPPGPADGYSPTHHQDKEKKREVVVLGEEFGSRSLS